MDISANKLSELHTFEKILICDIENQDIYYVYKDGFGNYYNELGNLIDINHIPYRTYKYTYDYD